MLGWILDKKIDIEMLNKSTKLEDSAIANSLTTIKSSENKSKLGRIVDADLNLIQTYVSCDIFDVLVQLKEHFKKKSIMLACMECNIVFDAFSVCWKCLRCLLWFHKTCKKKYPRESGTNRAFCDKCYIE